MKGPLPTMPEESPPEEQLAKPAKNKPWTGGIVGSISGTLTTFIVSRALISAAFCPTCATGLDPSFIIIFCGQIVLIGAFLGFWLGLIGNIFGKFIERKIDAHFELSLIFALIAGTLPGVLFFLYGVTN